MIISIQEKIGQVISIKMQKTAVIQVTRKILHPIYKKVILKTKKYLVHDENQVLKVGDKILIKECRPISKKKCWILVAIL